MRAVVPACKKRDGRTDERTNEQGVSRSRISTNVPLIAHSEILRTAPRQLVPKVQVEVRIKKHLYQVSASPDP